MNDIERDPFVERADCRHRATLHVLGASIDLRTNSSALLKLASHAFARLPRHDIGPTPRLAVTLKLARRSGPAGWRTPPAPRLSSGAGAVLSTIDATNFALVMPRQRAALVCVAAPLLKFPYVLRYELIEFAVVTLVARTVGLVPLHAACVGIDGRGVLLLGESGAGKSTLALHAALGGLSLLGEDSVFVRPATLFATGVPTFLHARSDSMALVGDPKVRRRLRREPAIRRRSGVRKLEIDFRGADLPLARRSLKIVATVVLSARRPGRAARLTRLSRADLRRVLRIEQPYAALQPGWREFESRALDAGGYLLGRAAHPAAGVELLRELLG